MHAADSWSTAADESAAPAWIRGTLWAAAVYNLAWGGLTIFFPLAQFTWFGFDPLPNYPPIWQCLGMVIGVYGIGYALAARDPVRHWPIVFVGLLGKLLGPLGFLMAAARGDMPWSFGWTLLTNDLVWWVPFGLILLHAWRAEMAGPWRAAADRDLRRPDPWDDVLAASGETLRTLAARGTLLVVFLRHAGCTFCREALADLRAQRAQIEGAGARIVVVHMGPEDDATRRFFNRYELGDVERISDPECRLYRAFHLGLGSWSQLFGGRVWLRGAAAALVKGHGVGRLAGNGLQMPGAFVIREGRVARAFRHATAADRPDYAALVGSADGRPAD